MCGCGCVCVCEPCVFLRVLSKYSFKFPPVINSNNNAISGEKRKKKEGKRKLKE